MKSSDNEAELAAVSKQNTPRPETAGSPETTRRGPADPYRDGQGPESPSPGGAVPEPGGEELGPGRPARGDRRAKPRRRPAVSRRAQDRAGLALVAPALILTTIFFFIPMVLSLWWSFTKYNGNRPPQYVGLKNYADLMSDPTFTAAASNTAVFAIVTMTIGPFLGLVSALLLNRARAFQAFFRSAFFLPVTMSLVVVASMWKMILNDAGLLNKFLEFFGIPGHDWLADPSTSLMSVSMASIWQGFGFETVIFLAALQSIPREHYEAAAVDGAGPLRTFMAVTLPALRPTLLFVYVMGTIGAFQVFDQIYVMTQGGPTSSTTTLVYYIVERFHSFDLGKASAAAYLLAAFLAVASAIQMKIERRGA